MVLGAMGVSLLPVVFLFFFSYALVNRTLNLWFPRPLEIANEESQVLLTNFGTAEFDSAERPGFRSGDARYAGPEPPGAEPNCRRRVDRGRAGPSGCGHGFREGLEFRSAKTRCRTRRSRGDAVTRDPPQLVRTTGSGAQVWQAGSQLYHGGTRSREAGTLRCMPPAIFLTIFSSATTNIETQTASLRAAEATFAGVQTRDFADADADYLAAAFYDHLGRAVSLEASDRSDSGAGRGHARNIAGQFRSSHRSASARRTGNAGAIVQSHDRAAGRRTPADQRIHARAWSKPSKSANAAAN